MLKTLALSLGLLLFALPAHAAFVQIDGSGKVVAVYGIAQNSPTPPGYAVIADDDARLTAFVARQSVPTDFINAIGAGVTITSTGTPSLNGTYAVDAGQQQNINSVISSILLNGTFTNGQATRIWPDRTGGLHTFDVAHFKALATAIGNYVDALILTRETLLAGGSMAWPSSAYTIP